MALQFPINNREDYKGRILFQVMQDRGITQNDAVQDFQGTGKSSAGPIEETFTNIQQAANSVLQDARNLLSFNGQASDMQTQTGNGEQAYGGDTVSLYLPQAIQIADAAEYENVQLGAIGATIEKGIANGENILKGLANGITDEISSLVSVMKSGQLKDPAAAVAANRAATKFGDGVAGAIRSQTRVTLNPNTRALFKSVPLREFAFNFKLIPTSADEAEEIKRIIHFFRSELYPADIPVEGVSLGYYFPNRFKIKMTYDGKEVATRLQKCYLRNFNAVYNQNSMGMHSDGNFSEVDISLTFMESRALTRADINAGY